ncbi:MAG: hypothetical protein V2A66_07410 [Pseudomonadota bacterium]
MIKQEDLSAEEKLLQVIQNGGESPFPEERSFLNKFYQELRSMFHRREASSGPKPDAASVLVRLNKALIASGVLVIALSGINIFFFQPKIGLLQSRVAEALPAQDRPSLNLPPVDEFLASLARRSLFQPTAGEAAPRKPSPADADMAGVMENFKLVGIAWGAAPEAMIREVKEGRTFFLKEGQKLKGVLVKQILKDRVIMEYNGQTKEFI